MSYEPAYPFWQMVYNWQMLIADLIALLAALITACFTMIASKRQVDVAKNEVMVTQNIERRRILRENYAFAIMLQVAMDIVVEDVRVATVIFGGPHNDTYSIGAFDARQRIKKGVFSEISRAMVRLGGTLTSQFLRLDQEIDYFSSRFQLHPEALLERKFQ